MARGNEVVPVVLDDPAHGRLHTPAKYAQLAARTVAAARRVKPDVVYAHYLVPTGLIAAATRRPFVVTAHGGDVANAEARPAGHGHPRGDRPGRCGDLRVRVPGRAAAEHAAPAGGDRLRRRHDRLAAGAAGARRRAAVPVRRLADGAQERRPVAGRVPGAGRGDAADPSARGRSRVRCGRSRRPASSSWAASRTSSCSPSWPAATRVGQPSLVELQGQAAAGQALACARPVVATRVRRPTGVRDAGLRRASRSRSSVEDIAAGRCVRRRRCRCRATPRCAWRASTTSPFRPRGSKRCCARYPEAAWGCFAPHDGCSGAS